MAHAGKVSTGSRRGRTPAEEKRPMRVRRYQYLILIVCEDTRTEKLYFEQAFPDLPDNTVYVLPIGTGRDQLGVVRQAVVEREALQKEFKRGVDQVWLVFDKDDADSDPTKTARFDEALEIASEEKMQLAFSNEVFELWLLLHFESVDPATPLSRAKVYELLDVALRNHPLFATVGYHHKKTQQHKQSKPADVLRAVSETGDETLAHTRAETLLAGTR